MPLASHERRGRPSPLQPCRPLPPTRVGCSQHPIPAASGVSPVMPLDRMPSISLGIIVPAGATYDRHHHWHTDTGEPRASVGFEAGGHSHAHLQGSPAALRELAAALLDAADRANSTVDPAPALVEGWRADVG